MVDASPSASEDASWVSAKWFHSGAALRIPTNVNVRNTFGRAAFIVDQKTNRVVTLDELGTPTAPLKRDTTYVVHTAVSRDCEKQVKKLKGVVAVLNQDLNRLRERMGKVDACFGAEVLQLRSMLEAGSLRGSHVACSSSGANVSLTGGSYSVDAAPGHCQTNRSYGDGVSVSCRGGVEDVGRRVIPIGYLRSPFIEKNGTPRQGVICPSVCAQLKLELHRHPGELNATYALEGLENFSHVWVLFLFDRDDIGSGTKSKIRPPRLDGVRTGLFSTRTPHRPNQIGLSLVKLDRIVGDTLHLSAIDLCDGTAVLDLKPYVPFADSVNDARVAPWLSHLPTSDLFVSWTPRAERELEALAPSFEFFSDFEQARSAITEILTADPRSVHWRQSRSDLEYGFSIDCLNVVCVFSEGNQATIQSVSHIYLCDRSHIPVKS